MKITLGFSTCPNDTFMFDAWVNGRLPGAGNETSLSLDDILHLNQRALAGSDDVLKISYNTYGKILDEYQLLRAGSAMGKGCGPLLVAKPGTTLEMLEQPGAVIAIPGFNTTANLLLSFYAPGLKNKKEMLFHEVMPAVEKGEALAGLIIHENRFTYPDHGLICLVDLGEHWEKVTGLPIPLGAIVAKKNLGREALLKINQLMRRSVEYAFAHPEASKAYVREHAQEMDETVCRSHIELYVNDFSVDFGPEGETAIARLLEVGERQGNFEPGTVEKFKAQMKLYENEQVNP